MWHLNVTNANAKRKTTKMDNQLLTPDQPPGNMTRTTVKLDPALQQLYGNVANAKKPKVLNYNVFAIGTSGPNRTLNY